MPLGYVLQSNYFSHQLPFRVKQLTDLYVRCPILRGDLPCPWTVIAKTLEHIPTIEGSDTTLPYDANIAIRIVGHVTNIIDVLQVHTNTIANPAGYGGRDAYMISD